MERVSPAAAIMLLALRGAASWDDFVTVTLSDKALARHAGVKPSRAWRIRTSEDFLKLC